MPTPDPSTWATEPYVTGTRSAKMVASTSSGTPGPIEYGFEETTTGLLTWLTTSTYEPGSLTPATTYTFKVKTRNRECPPIYSNDSSSVSIKTHTLPTLTFPDFTGESLTSSSM